MRRLRALLYRLLSGPRVVLPTAPIPGAWTSNLPRWVPLSERLPGADRSRLLRLAQLFVRDVPMEGCGGLELTDEIRVTIGATASLLLLKLPYPRFPRLRRVLVYPDTFVPVRIGAYSGPNVQEVPVPELGEAWRDGIVVLSWRDVLRGNADPGDGRNVVLHEFAHVLDHEDGAADGRPILDSAQAKLTWGTVMRGEFERQRLATERGEDTLLDPYAATNRAEFFAVATETFFEAGALMRAHLPALYEQLRRFYKQDPASLEPGSGGDRGEGLV